jgi:integrase
MPRKPKKKGRTRANGLGEKELLPSGRIRWRLRDATRKTLAFGTVDDDRAANNAIAAAMTARAKGTLAQRSKITLREYATTWLERQHGLAANTRLDYWYNLEYALKLIGDKPVQAITREDIKALMSTLVVMKMTHGSGTGRPMAARTLGKILTRLRAVFREALEDDLILKNPAATIKPVKPMRTEHPGFSLDFVQAARAVAIGKALHARDALRLWPAIFTCLSIGLRRGEVMALTWAHVDLETSTLFVRQQLTVTSGQGMILKPAPKTSAGNRDIPIPPSLVAVLEQHKAAMRTERLEIGLPWTAETPVFPTVEDDWTHPDNLDRSVRNLADWTNPGSIKRIRKDAGGERIEVFIPLERRLIAIAVPVRADLETLIRSGTALPAFSPHDLRHTAGSHMLMRGMKLETVSKILGHRDSSITRQVYIHLSDLFVREDMVDLFPLD